MQNFNINDLKKRMEGAINNLNQEFRGIRSGRANVNLLEPITVDAYGQSMKIRDLASVSTPEPRMFLVQVWDANLVTNVEKSIRESDLGLNPNSEGQVIRIQLPDLTAERRLELAKTAQKYAELAKVSIRNIRQDGMNTIKREGKNNDISEDLIRENSDKIQSITDEYISKISEMADIKEKEITTV